MEDDSFSELGWVHLYAGLKKTFRFQTYDGTKTNWFMDEYIPMKSWGFDLYMEVRIVHIQHQNLYLLYMVVYGGMNVQS